MGEKGGAGLPPSGFGPALRHVRTEKGLTQKELGDAAGIHANTIARMERGETEPSWQVVLALATALGISCEAFSVGTVNPLTVEPTPKKGAKKK